MISHGLPQVLLQRRVTEAWRLAAAEQVAAHRQLGRLLAAWRVSYIARAAETSLRRIGRAGWLANSVRRWSRAIKQRDLEGLKRRRCNAVAASPAAGTLRYRRCWRTWRILILLDQELCAKVALPGQAKLVVSWTAWKLWARSPSRQDASSLMQRLPLHYHRRRCWQAWLMASLRAHRRSVLDARAAVHAVRAAMRRALLVLVQRREAHILSQLVQVAGRHSAALLTEWVSRPSERMAIGRAIAQAVRVSKRRAWAAWRLERADRSTQHLLLHRANRLSSIRAGRSRTDAFHHWSVSVLSRALREAALQHWADEFRPRSFRRAGWRRWRAGLRRQAMAAHLLRALDRSAEQFLFARCAAALAHWSTVATRLLRRRMLRSRKQAERQDDVAVDQLRVLLADGRKWAERMLIADGYNGIHVHARDLISPERTARHLRDSHWTLT